MPAFSILFVSSSIALAVTYPLGIHDKLLCYGLFCFSSLYHYKTSIVSYRYHCGGFLYVSFSFVFENCFLFFF